jgi:cell division protein FtsI/penicillin-binding protein 2
MNNSSNWRLNLILVFVLLFAAGIVSRLFYLQILERKLFQAQALGQQTAFNSVIGQRGQIFCQNSQQEKGSKSSGVIKSLATNKDSWIVSLNLSGVDNKEEFSNILSQVLNISKDQIIIKLNGNDNYVVLEKGLSSEQLDKIKRLNLSSVSWQNDPERIYPQGKIASHVIGFFGGENIGQYGVEGYYENILKGKIGVKEKGSGINAILSNDGQDQLDGSDIYLTIDYNIQFQAEQLLKQERIDHNIDSGQIIVMRPDTGRILALADYPNFNPNQYSKEKDLSIFQNSVVQKLFEPGSVLKPFTMAAALNEGKVTPETTYFDTGRVAIGPDVIHNFNFEKMGLQTMTGILENSLNTGITFVEQSIGKKTFLNYLDKFGFFSKTDVDLQGEVYSQNSRLKSGSDFDFATAAFGQGIQMTPIQLARAYCMIANGGKMVKPYIVDRIVNQAGQDYIEPEVSSRTIISQKTASQINSMLISVVDNGFNSVAKIPGYYFAGKTGTAQVPLLNGKGYDPDKTIQSFVGYGPALNPQFLILVKLDDPKVSKSSLSAVPVFKQLAQYIINYWQISPDYDINVK